MKIHGWIVKDLEDGLFFGPFGSAMEAEEFAYDRHPNPIGVDPADHYMSKVEMIDLDLIVDPSAG